MTDKDKVRLLIADVGGESGTDFIFSDSEILVFLELRGGNVHRAAATALRTIASNRVQTAQVISYLGLETHGDNEASALKSLANDYEAAADSGADTAIEFADLVKSDFGP